MTEPSGKLLPPTMPVTFIVFPGRIVASDFVPLGHIILRYWEELRLVIYDGSTDKR